MTEESTLLCLPRPEHGRRNVPARELREGSLVRDADAGAGAVGEVVYDPRVRSLPGC